VQAVETIVSAPATEPSETPVPEIDVQAESCLSSTELAFKSVTELAVRYVEGADAIKPRVAGLGTPVMLTCYQQLRG
jgi:hypothetical protein